MNEWKCFDRDMTMKLYEKLLLLACFVFLNGCSVPATKTYEPPTDWQAKQCLEYCVSERMACRALVQKNLDACKDAYQAELQRYEYCRVYRVYGCRRPREACSAPQFNRCTDGYDVCFVGCGGKIRAPDDRDGDEDEFD
jgi:hypothetical protein